MDQDSANNGGLPDIRSVESGVTLLGGLPQPVLEAVATILALGLVFSVLELIYLSFLYPSQLSVVAGIIVPLITALWHGHQVLAERRKRINNVDSNLAD